jgi:large subunit ribosomal protein L5
VSTGAPGKSATTRARGLLHGLSPRAFDGRGNYNFGIREHQIFTEVDPAVARTQSFGMNITMVTSAKDDAQCRALLKRFGVPFRES